MLKESEVSLRAKTINKWVCSRLMPSGHRSEIIRERVILNYMLQRDRPINFGNLVAHRVFRVVTGVARTQGLIFPHIITDICASFGVPIGDGERNFRPDPTVVCRPAYVPERDDPMPDVQFGDVEYDDEDDSEDEDYEPAEEAEEAEYDDGGYGYRAHFDEVAARLEGEMQRVRGDVTSLQMDVTVLQQEHQRSHYDAAYARQQNDHMHAMFDRFASHLSINMDGLPPWPQYQPPDFGDQ